MRLLVTGGAGYIGAHVVALLLEAGHEVVVVDDLSSGTAHRLEAPVVKLDVADPQSHVALAAIMAEQHIEAVIHLAARKQVGESMLRPEWYRAQNVGGVSQVLRAMYSAGVDRLVFSSTAAVYGEVDGAPVSEDAPTVPINPYGETKLEGERLISAAAAEWGLRAASLRFFNAVGAASPELGDNAPANLVPVVLDRLDLGLPPAIFGDDWPTADGTCVRDYIHVSDLAEVHVEVLQLLDGKPGNQVLNVGTGRGVSVRQMIDNVFAVTGRFIDPVVVPRRAGDSASVVASVDRIQRVLGWRASRDVEEMVRSAWEAHLVRVAV